ncbi:MAG TPA: hypothetical protein VFK22_07060 [Candidatus Dormibacteraeota bacterium]|nr:hypothetical protein [Candidatus Dormibacteraeota bacterium]
MPETVTEDQWLSEMRAWIRAGGTYRLRPAIGPAVSLCVLALFFPALIVLLSLAFSDLALGIEAAIVGLVPIGGVALLIAYRQRASLYVDSHEIGRTGLRGSTIARCPRDGLGAVQIRKGSYEAWLGSALRPYGTFDDNVMYVLDKRGGVVFKVTLHVWSPYQVELLGRLAQ